MTYFTRGTRAFEKFNSEDQEGADFCDHCESDRSLVTHYIRESDAFGTVALYLMCTRCKEHQDLHGTEICDDCLETIPTAEIESYRCYGFNPSQGDQELQLCKSCWVLPKHQSRLSEDKQQRALDEQELEDYQSEED